MLVIPFPMSLIKYDNLCTVSCLLLRCEGGWYNGSVNVVYFKEEHQV